MMSSSRNPKKAMSKGLSISNAKKPDALSCSLSTHNAASNNYPTQTPSESNVEKITGRRYVNGQVEMQVKWEGFPPEMCSWEPLENLRNCMGMVSEFEKKLSKMIEMAKKTSNLRASSGSKWKLDKKRSAIKASPDSGPGERQLETGKTTGQKSNAKEPYTPHPNTGVNIGGNQKLHLQSSDDETLSLSFSKCASSTLTDRNIFSGSNTLLLSELRTFNTTKKANPTNSNRKHSPQSQAKQNMTKFSALPNAQKKHVLQAKAFTIQKQGNTISETPKKPIKKTVHSMNLAVKRSEVQTVVQAFKESKKSTKKIQKQESSDEDSGSPLMAPYQTVFGLARGLELDKVVNSYCVGDRHFLFVTWKGIEVVDSVPMEELKEAYPAEVLKYLEKTERRFQ